MNHLVFRTILWLFGTINISSTFGQDNSVSDSLSFQFKKKTAILSAKTYLDKKFSNKEISKQFIADSVFSLIICGDYKIFFNSKSIYCLPVRFEIAFHIILNGGSSWGTLPSHLFLPVDSSFTVLADSLQNEWRHGFFDAWEKVISNKYKVNYSDVLQFAKNKNLQDYTIDFSFEAKRKSNFKFYWFVTEDSVLYRINPATGAVKMKKLSPVKTFEDVSYAANMSIAAIWAGQCNISNSKKFSFSSRHDIINLAIE